MPAKLKWTGLLAAGMLAAAPAAAQGPLPGVRAVSDTVQCTYDLMSAEDREITLLLFGRGVTAATPQAAPANLAVIDRLVREASDQCARRARWPRARIAAASDYAMNALMGEGVSQALTSRGRSTAPIAAYYAAHQAQLSAAGEVDAAAGARLKTHLVQLGWDVPAAGTLGAGTLGAAVFYLEALVSARAAAEAFAAAPAHAAAGRPAFRPAPRRPAIRARTAAHGKP